MKKIVLINCYIGKFPWFFNLFIKSCEFNPTIDFFIFTDNIIEDKIPFNVHLIPFTLADFNILASKKLGFNVNIENPYKLCDFKPAYGELFSEYLDGYDFWGITDIDVVYGRIREFMTDELLDNNEIICIRHDFITACCMLFKNNTKINLLFKKSADYKMIFTSKKNYCFDEANFEQASIIDKYDIFSIDCEIVSMQHVILSEEKVGNLKCHFDFIMCEGTPGRLKWDKGIFSYDDKFEIILYHLLNYKGNIFSNKKMIWDIIPDVFYIDKFNFRDNNSMLLRLKAFYKDNIFFFLWKQGKVIDIYISTKIIKRKFYELQEGKYYYYLNKKPFIVSKEIDGSNFMSFSTENKYPIFSLFFSKNYFCLSGLPHIFRLDDKTNSSYNKFKCITEFGFSNLYNKIENHY
ncbi:DUF6625 family protein [Flavobacterium sp. HJJ]|uniref:DUF6625 family protein n=1 Tax=Flavobacterium sp. HJJ TaxID=2783792 RepID=UPI00188BD948|nr:DUF6625 family protein [Flavobacterium sp. HJJ]MBF4472439.1 hypothetical protein [Flavobacterium sp. HJJ]